MAATICVLVPTLVISATPKAELEAVRRDLLAWLPGEYDSLPQVDLERRVGSPGQVERERQFRLFARIDAPQLGEDVVYAETRVGGTYGPVNPGQQVVYTFTIDEARGAVVASGRRIKDPSAFTLADLTPENQALIEAVPDDGGDCDLLWRRHGSQLVGRLTESGGNDGSCILVAPDTGEISRWEAEWILNPRELWISGNGFRVEADDGMTSERLVTGRADRTHERLYKSRVYRCEILGPNRPKTVADVGDRGGVVKLEFGDWPQPTELTLLRAFYPGAGGVGYVERLRLSLVAAGANVPAAEVVAEPGADTIAISTSAGRVSCAPAEGAA